MTEDLFTVEAEGTYDPETDTLVISTTEAEAWEERVAAAEAGIVFEHRLAGSWSDEGHLCTIEGWSRCDDEPREFLVRFLTPWTTEYGTVIDFYEGVPATHLHEPSEDVVATELRQAISAVGDAEEARNDAQLRLDQAQALEDRLVALYSTEA